MKVRNICAPVFGATPIRKKSESGYTNNTQNDNNTSCSYKLASYSTAINFAQIQMLNFAGRNHHKNTNPREQDVFESAPPELEIKKYNISKDVQRYIENEDYLSAIKGKLKLAEICRSQKKKEDTFYLEDSIKRLYNELPKYQKNEAKDLIRTYNKDMAAHIDRNSDTDFEDLQ